MLSGFEIFKFFVSGHLKSKHRIIESHWVENLARSRLILAKKITKNCLFSWDDKISPTQGYVARMLRYVKHVAVFLGDNQ